MLNARALELVSGMESPPPGARGPMRRTIEDVGTWAEGDATAAVRAYLGASVMSAGQVRLDLDLDVQQDPAAAVRTSSVSDRPFCDFP